MKTILKFLIDTLLSTFMSNYAGKIIGMLDFCRMVICNNKNCFAGQIHSRMDIKNLIKNDDFSNIDGIIEETDKIKVRIVYPSGCSWNNIHTLYDEFIKDDRFQTYILVKNEMRFISIMKKVGCNFTTLDFYDIKNDMPDIFITTSYSNSDPEISFPQCRKYMKKVYSVFPNAVMNEENNDIHWSCVYNAYKYFKPDLYFLDPLPYNALKNYIDNNRLIRMGNPQFDEIYFEVGKDHPLPKTWDKLKGKTVFLWATDHGINESYAKNGFTIDLYLGEMIHYFTSHDNIALIFRPHPQFIREMMTAGHFWSSDDLLRLKEFINRSDNIVWDDTMDFCCAYDACDAIMVDCNCSITCTALTTGKPICRLMRNDIKEWLISQEISDCYYYADSFDKCKSFIEMVIRGEDHKKELRRKALNNVVLNFDGRNGMRIKNFITKDFFGR